MGAVLSNNSMKANGAATIRGDLLDGALCYSKHLVARKSQGSDVNLNIVEVLPGQCYGLNYIFYKPKKCCLNNTITSVDVTFSATVLSVICRFTDISVED